MKFLSAYLLSSLVSDLVTTYEWKELLCVSNVEVWFDDSYACEKQIVNAEDFPLLMDDS